MKETRTEVTLENFSDFQFETHTAKLVDFGVQCYIEILEEQPLCTLDMFETETESECCQESDYANSDVSDNEKDKQITSPSKAAFIVYWTSLIVLLKKYLHSTCLMLATITNLTFKGSQLIVRLKCYEGHETEWKSQPNCNHYSVGNLTSAASVLFSANTFQTIAQLSRNPVDIQNKFLRNPKPLSLWYSEQKLY